MSSKGKTNKSCTDYCDSTSVSCVQAVHLSAHSSLNATETKIFLDSYADACIVGDYIQIVHDHSRTVNVFGYNYKAGSNDGCIINVAAAYTEPETGNIIILLINKTI